MSNPRRHERYVTKPVPPLPARVRVAPERVIRGGMCAVASVRAGAAAGSERSRGMSEKFSTGDHVTWRPTVRASDDEPQYEVRSDTSGRTAVHRPGALDHETGDRT
jgi:hypothetical protein